MNHLVTDIPRIARIFWRWVISRGVRPGRPFAHCQKKPTISLMAIRTFKDEKSREDVCMVSHRISASHFVN